MEISAEEAFEALGVNANSTVTEVTKAYYELSKIHHPDSRTGNEARQSYLNGAYDVALQHLKGGQLVPLEVKNAVKVIERGLAVQEASLQISNASTTMKRRRTQRLQILKYASIVVAAAAGFLGWFGVEQQLPTFPPTSREPSNPASIFVVGLHIFWDAVKQASKPVSVALGASAGILQLLVHHQNYLVDSLTDALNDDTTCITMLERHSHLFEGNSYGVTVQDIADRIIWKYEMHHYRPIVRYFGRFYYRLTALFRLTPEQTARLLVLKSMEHGFIEHAPDTKRRYRLSTEGQVVFREHGIISSTA